jgi:hypothetical protein
MMHVNRGACGVLVVVLCALWGCQQSERTGSAVEASGGVSAQEVAPVDVKIELTGSGLARPTVFTFEALANMKMTRLDNVLMLKSHEPDETTSWEGPALEVLFTSAGIKPGPMTITLEAPDNYEADCTRDELRSAIVALKDGNGRWLYEVDPRCPIRLVPPELPGNYWVMNPSCITVEPDDVAP